MIFAGFESFFSITALKQSYRLVMKFCSKRLSSIFSFVSAMICANWAMAQNDAHAPVSWRVHHQGEQQFVLEGFCQPGWKVRGPATPELSIPGSETTLAFGALQVTLVTPAAFSGGHGGHPPAKAEIKINWPPAETLSSPLMPGETWLGYSGTVSIPFELLQPKTLAAHPQLVVEGVACSDSECRPFRHTFDVTALAASQASLNLGEAYNPEALTPAAERGWSLLGLLLLAFAGGAILNLMPCVLPVLALKIVSYVSARGQARPKRSFFFTTVGILVSFLILALMTAGLRQTGQFMGWGLHFQHPGFLLFMGLLTLVFACNLMGLFEWMLPRRLQNRLDDLFHKPSAAGAKDFLAGAFATLLATPCTAPFLGIAMGYAISQSFANILIFFLVAGLGFAFPYLVLMILPATWIPHPKPGPWMAHLRRILGFALLGTSLWLGSVWWAVTQAPAVKARPSAQNSAQAQASFETLIAQHVRAGRVVLVNVTAAWCLTCQVNKRVAFRNLDAWLKQSHGKLVFIEMDWTRPDPNIAAFLTQHRRAGIPLTVVYGPNEGGQGQALSELLSENELIKALQEAGLALQRATI